MYRSSNDGGSGGKRGRTAFPLFFRFLRGELGATMYARVSGLYANAHGVTCSIEGVLPLCDHILQIQDVVFVGLAEYSSVDIIPFLPLEGHVDERVAELWLLYSCCV